MKDILQQIVADKQAEIERLKRAVSVDDMYRAAAEHPHSPFRASIEAAPNGIVAEFKRRSPSKGWIRREADPAPVARGYEAGGAAAVSILTDGKYFGGSLDDIAAARHVTEMPILRKDFIIDEYQLHQAKAAGADAVLLIAAAISEPVCRRLARTARGLGLETLLEIHTEDEIEHIGDNIDVVGVNNRNLGTFNTSISASEYLAPKLPRSLTLISESGIRGAADIVGLQMLGYRGFLIGELLMSDGDPGQNLRKLASDIEKLTAARL